MIKILLVGCGHMGSALLYSWSRKTSFNFSVIDPNNYQHLKKNYSKKISIYKSFQEIKNIRKFDIIIFAVKPQISKEVVRQFNFLFNRKVLFISIIAGKKINFFERNLCHSHQIIRVMPNMPALVEKGMTCLFSNRITSKKNKIIANDLFKSVGKTIWLKSESDLDKVTAISGSGPAYYFLFIEYLITETARLGLKKSVAQELVYQTAIGSLELLEKGSKDAQELRKQIAVKGGTTEAAINIFQKDFKFKKIIGQALNAAYNRAKNIGNI